jgi:hypothetical protein
MSYKNDRFTTSITSWIIMAKFLRPFLTEIFHQQQSLMQVICYHLQTILSNILSLPSVTSQLLCFLQYRWCQENVFSKCDAFSQIPRFQNKSSCFILSFYFSRICIIQDWVKKALYQSNVYFQYVIHNDSLVMFTKSYEMTKSLYKNTNLGKITIEHMVLSDTHIK